MFCKKTFQDNSETQSLMRGDVEERQWERIQDRTLELPAFQDG